MPGGVIPSNQLLAVSKDLRPFENTNRLAQSGGIKRIGFDQRTHLAGIVGFDNPDATRRLPAFAILERAGGIDALTVIGQKLLMVGHVPGAHVCEVVVIFE